VKRKGTSKGTVKRKGTSKGTVNLKLCIKEMDLMMLFYRGENHLR